MYNNNSHKIFTKTLEGKKDPNEEYIEAIKIILGHLTGNIDTETYDSLVKCVNGILTNYSGNRPVDLVLIEKENGTNSIVYIKTALQFINKELDHFDIELLKKLLVIANQLKEKDQTDQTDVTYDDNLPNDRG